MNDNIENMMNKFYELEKKRTEKMEKEAYDALAYIFTKYGGDPISPEMIHDLILSVFILHGYGYCTPEQIYELMYRIEIKGILKNV